MKIYEAYRFCPRCAKPLDGEPQIPFRCHECDFAQFFGPVAAVGGLVVNDSGELLMVRRAKDPGKGKLGLPGGFVDQNETIEQALAREIAEETSLRISKFEYLMSSPNQYVYAGVEAPVIDMFYKCQVVSTEGIELDQTELSDFLWVRPSSEQLDDMAFESNRLAVERWLESVP